MTDKKDPGKFTIRFNICDPQHKAVIDLLNRQGRSKAQFLVSAVLHYINCKETPEVSVPVPNQAALEEMILAILTKNQSYSYRQRFSRSVNSRILCCLFCSIPHTSLSLENVPKFSS